jgi:putative endonuclease
MRRERRYYVYILTSSSRRALYIGITNDIYIRVMQHRNPDAGSDSFTAKYRVTRLVYVEVFKDVRNAIAREKELKGWTRNRKNALVQSANPGWRDLAEGWGEKFPTLENQTQDPSRQKQGAQDDNRM